VLDGTAGLWCCNAGHGRREIVEAIQKQAAIMDFAPTFQLGHPIAFEAAQRVAEMTPEGMDRVFFVNSGSEAADTALKIALAYHKARGQIAAGAAGRAGTRLPRRRLRRHVGRRHRAEPQAVRRQLPYVDHLPHTHLPAQNRFCRGQPEHGAHLADALENLVALHGDTIAAVMVEPVAGSTGVLVPPVGYLERCGRSARSTASC
jgi:beta-alanine--pyruvate transaminase